MSEVRAAGGVVTRLADGQLEVAVIHRPRYDDWSLPKGKEAPGERALDTARREIAEEAGLVCVFGPELPPLAYVDQYGRDKTVRYWLARAARSATGDDLARFGVERDTPTTPTDGEPEVDALRWLRFDDAAAIVTRPDDAELLQRAAGVAASTKFVFLVRHARAGNRGAWRGDDRDRPLSPSGRRQADALAELATGGVAGLLSSPYVRCRQTLEPLAERTGVDIVEVKDLTEGSDPERAHRCLQTAPDGAVACSHGDVIGWVIEMVVDELEAFGTDVDDADRCGKASTWVLALQNGRPVAANYLRPPRT